MKKTRALSTRFKFDQTWALAIPLVVMLVIGIGASFYYNKALVETAKRMQEVKTDNMTWTISQLEVSALKLQLTIERAWNDRGSDRKDVVREFDIFYSRVDSVNSILGQTDLDIKDEDLDTLVRLIDVRDRMADIIDNAPKTQPLPFNEIYSEIASISPDIRLMLTSMFARITKRTNAQGVEHQGVLDEYGWFSIYYEIMLVLVLILGLRLVHLAQQRALQAREFAEIFETTLNCSPDAVIVTDKNLYVTQYNPAAERMLGYSHEEAIGRDLKNMIVPDRLKQRFQEQMDELERTGTTRILGEGRTIRLARDKSGREFAAEVTAIATQTAEGAPVYIVFMNDISERQAAQKNLEAALSTAEESVRARERFLAVMSHEMRTPLQGVIASLDLANNARNDFERKQLLDTAQKSSEQALDQVNNILEFTRMADTSAAPSMVPFRLTDVANELVNANKSLLVTKGNRVVLALDDDAESIVRASKRDLDTLLQNLFSNANKFTTDGVITVRMSTESKVGNMLTMRIQIEDSGVGIADDMKSRVFDDFETANKNVPSKLMGTGLGLGIAKRAATRLGGTLDLSSELGVGTVFILRAPFELVMETPEEKPAEQDSTASNGDLDFSGRRVLIAEDHSTNRKLIEMMLARFGFDTFAVEDGAEAVKAASGADFDLIVTDINMPNMGGLEAASMISKTAAHSAVPIIAMTAFTVDDLAEFDQAGITFIVPKPVTLASISQMLERLVTEDRISVASKPGAGKTPASKKDDTVQGTSIDTDIFGEMVMIAGPNAARSFVDKFVSEQRGFIKETTQLLESNDTAAASKIAHKAIGSAALLGASELAKIMRDVQDNAKNNQSAPSLQALEQAAKMLEAAHRDMQTQLSEAG